VAVTPLTRRLGALAPRAVASTRSASRVALWRRRLLIALLGGSLMALVAALVVALTSLQMGSRYNAIVHTGAVSVDAAQDARADILDNAGANADVLTPGAATDTARQRATARYASYQEDLRRSWQNRSDVTQGEYAVFDAADRATTDYASAIGGMYNELAAGRTEDANKAFLDAYNILNQRLLPALGGLESVKVEYMESAYASTSSTMHRDAIAVVIASAALLALIAAGYLLTRRMHHLVTIELMAAAVLAVIVGGYTALQLSRADTQAKVLVHDAYGMVAGARDTAAIVSQENMLESMAVFDPAGATQHFADFDNYDLQMQQGLCGFSGCVKTPFTSGGDSINSAVVAAALDGQDRFGLAHTPLVANVHFPGEAKSLEAARAQYVNFLQTDASMRTQVAAGNTQAAAATNAGASQTQFTATVVALDLARGSARTVYNSIWRSVTTAAVIATVLALADVAVAGLIAVGLWRRRQELFIANVR